MSGARGYVIQSRVNCADQRRGNRTRAAKSALKRKFRSYIYMKPVYSEVTNECLHQSERPRER